MGWGLQGGLPCFHGQQTAVCTGCLHSGHSVQSVETSSLIIGAQAAVCQGCLCQSGEVQSESLEVAVLPWIERFCLECVAHHLSSQLRVKIDPMLCVYFNV